MDPPPPRSDVPPSPSAGACSLAADPEVRRVGGAIQPARVNGRADRDADPDLAELAPEDVGLVAGRAHPCGLDLPRGGQVAGAPGDVLAQRPALARAVARAEDAVDHVGAVRRRVVEEALRDHVVAVPLGRLAELRVLLQRREPARAALLVV